MLSRQEEVRSHPPSLVPGASEKHTQHTTKNSFRKKFAWVVYCLGFHLFNCLLDHRHLSDPGQIRKCSFFLASLLGWAPCSVPSLARALCHLFCPPCPSSAPALWKEAGSGPPGYQAVKGGLQTPDLSCKRLNPF